MSLIFRLALYGALFTGYAHAKPCLSPTTQTRVDQTLEQIYRRSQQPPADTAYTYAGGSTRADLLKHLYDTGLVEASPFSEALYDKEVSAEVFKALLGPRFEDFFPRTVLDRQWLCEGDRRDLGEALKKDFPTGVIAKPVQSEGSGGNGFHNGYAAVAEYLKAIDLASREPFLLQAKVGSSFALDKDQPASHEFRVHVFWGEVVPGMTLERWRNRVSGSELKSVDAFTQSFLDLLPPGLTRNQAWSVDVIRTGDGTMRIVDFNTNGGLRQTWSGFLAHPMYLMRFTQYLENRFYWKFRGPRALLLRYGFGNSKQACEKLLKSYRRSGLRFRPSR